MYLEVRIEINRLTAKTTAFGQEEKRATLTKIVWSFRAPSFLNTSWFLLMCVTVIKRG